MKLKSFASWLIGLSLGADERDDTEARRAYFRSRASRGSTLDECLQSSPALRKRRLRPPARDARRRFFLSNVECALAGVRIGAILHPTVVLAFADRAGFLQQGNCPAS